MTQIRHANRQDLLAITEIYNEAILNTTATFDTEPKTVEEQQAWFDDHGGRYRIIVAEVDGVVAGWASLSKWSDRCAYSDTAEISLYVKEDFQGRGVGQALLDAIVEEGRSVELHSIIARIAEGNDVSVRMHESVGFEHIGIMREVGRKFGKLLDVYLMQKMLDAPERNSSST